METLAACGIFKKFGKKTILADIHFKLSKGERIGLIGPNGSGKTTLLKILSGLVPPSSGKVSVFLDNKEHKLQHFRKNIGLVSQEDSLDLTLNVQENLIYYGRYTGMDKISSLKRSEDLLNEMNLAHYKKSNINTLSSGTKKKISILRCLMNSPGFIFMDEPANHLDIQSRAWLKEIINSHSEKGFVLSSHDIDDIDLICNSIILLYEGEILAHGPSKDLIDQHLHRYVLEFLPGESFVNESLEWLQNFKQFSHDGRLCVFSDNKKDLLELSGKINCTSLTLRESSLKDLYLHLIKLRRGGDV